MAKGKGPEDMGRNGENKVVDLTGKPLSQAEAARRGLGAVRVQKRADGTTRTSVELLTTDKQMKQILAGQQAFVRLLKTLPGFGPSKPEAQISVLNIKNQLGGNSLNELWSLLGEENSPWPWTQEGTLESYAIVQRIIEEITRHESGAYALDIPSDVRAVIIQYAKKTPGEESAPNETSAHETRKESLEEASFDMVAAEMFFALKDNPHCTRAEIARVQEMFRRDTYDFKDSATGSPDEWNEDPAFYLVLADQRLRQIDAIANKVLGSIVAIVPLGENGDEQFQSPDRQLFETWVKTLRLFQFNQSPQTESNIQRIAIEYKKMRRLPAEIIPLFP